MDNEEVLEKFNQLVEQYGDQLPNHIHEPRRFSYYVRMTAWTKELEKLAVDSKPKG